MVYIKPLTVNLKSHVMWSSRRDLTIHVHRLAPHALGILTSTKRLGGSLASKPISFLRLLRLMNVFHYGYESYYNLLAYPDTIHHKGSLFVLWNIEIRYNRLRWLLYGQRLALNCLYRIINSRTVIIFITLFQNV